MGLLIHDFAAHLFSLDIQWLVSFIGQNIFFLFAFFAAASILTQGKSFKANIWWFAAVVLAVWSSDDLSKITGWAFYVPAFLFVHLISRLAVVFFTESIPQLQKWFSGVLVVQTIIVFAIFNLYFLNFA